MRLTPLPHPPIVRTLLIVGHLRHRQCPDPEGSVIEKVISVRLKRGEAVERALKRLKKAMDKEGMMRQLRANRYFEKPSEKRRRKSARARSRVATPLR